MIEYLTLKLRPTAPCPDKNPAAAADSHAADNRAGVVGSRPAAVVDNPAGGVCSPVVAGAAEMVVAFAGVGSPAVAEGAEMRIAPFAAVPAVLEVPVVLAELSELSAFAEAKALPAAEAFS